MGQISVKLKMFFCRLKTWTKTSVKEEELEKEVKESTSDQILSNEAKEEIEKKDDDPTKDESSAEKLDGGCLSVEDYNRQMASLEKAIDEQQKLIEEHNCKLAMIEKILQTGSFQENAKNSEDQQKAALEVVQNGTADPLFENEELTEQQVNGTQQTTKRPIVIADQLEAQQTKIEVIREILEGDRGLYWRGKQWTKQLETQCELLTKQVQSIEKLKAEFREDLRYQKLKLYFISTGIIIALIIIASLRI